MAQADTVSFRNLPDDRDNEDHQNPHHNSRRRPLEASDNSNDDRNNDNRRWRPFCSGGLQPTPFVRKRLGSQQLRHGVLRVSEYDEEYDCFLPRAPAFRMFPSMEVNEIVQRLYYIPPASRRTRSGKGGTDDQHTTPRPNPKFGGQRQGVSREDLYLINLRLSKPTKMSMMRERPPTHLPAIAN